MSKKVYDQWERRVLLVCFVLAVIGILIGSAGVITNGRQDLDADAANRTRDMQNAAVLEAQQKLLDCFDEYAAADSASSTKVREAAAAKDVATAAAWTALNKEGQAFLRLTKRLLTQTVTPEDVKLLSDTLEARADAGKALEDAQAELDRVRAANPIPDPPSEFCAD